MHERAVGVTMGDVRPTLLVVDDHPMFRAEARAILEADGFQVVAEAGDAASALEAVARLTPDVVLLDVQLPDASGLDLARAMARPGGPVVVLVSTHDRQSYGDRVEASGARGFIAKEDLTGDAVLALVRGGP
jgi:DNA-binding NarL/FixJ family response regulator